MPEPIFIFDVQEIVNFECDLFDSKISSNSKSSENTIPVIITKYRKFINYKRKRCKYLVILTNIENSKE